MTKILLLVAMLEELSTPPKSDMVLVHTGIGKVNAAWRCTAALAQHNPDLVINFGTAGAVNPALHGLIEVGAAVQRDMDVRALGVMLGTTPFEHGSAVIRFSPAPLICGTGDSFASAAPELPCDVVDMELYAIAKVCAGAGVPLRAFKYISDNADGTAPQDWRQALHRAEAAFFARINAGAI
jgi:adenosylhomocysteine nucleosidase